MCEALTQCEAVEYSEPPILRDGDPRRSNYFDWFYLDLEAFRDKIMASSSQDGALLGKMHDWLFWDENHHICTRWWHLWLVAICIADYRRLCLLSNGYLGTGKR